MKESLWEAGFDVFHGPFDPNLYNDCIESEGLVESGALSKLPMEYKGKGYTSAPTMPTEAYLIGNTKHLWPIFLRWLREENEKRKLQARHNDTDSNNKDTDRILIEDPLDNYEQKAIEGVVKRVLERRWQQQQVSFPTPATMGCDHNYDIYWSSNFDPAEMVSMGRIASCSGFSYLDPYTHLSVHPEYGTWHSYRAVLVLEKEESMAEAEAADPSAPRLVLLPDPLSPEETRISRSAFDEALRISTAETNETTVVNADDDTATDEAPAEETGQESGDTTTNEEPDRTLLCEELGKGNYAAISTTNDKASTTIEQDDRKSSVAAAWIALRDAVSIGRENYRFENDQLWYHYTKDDEFLLRGIKNETYNNNNNNTA